jgi:predicted RNA-binding Zn ribbon-like protein
MYTRIEPKPAENPGSLAGALCLDFANTAEWHASDHPQERLTGYAELLAWAKRKSILGEKEARALEDEAGRRPQEAARVLRRAVELREAIYQIFSRLAHAKPAPRTALELLNAGLAGSLGQARLRAGPAGFTWGWADRPGALDRALWPVMRSAAELLTSDLASRVGQCQDDRGCGWLFIDTSRNHTRRWCAMDDCGNRAKARRHYQRTQKSRTEGALDPAAQA